MGCWNVPLEDADLANYVCLSALAMLSEMDPLHARLESEAKEEVRKRIPLEVGLGLNCVECVVGNMGSDQRFDYSVLGDTVNLAARLEGQSKNYGVRVVIGHPTWLAVPTLATLELDFIQVKGKTEAARTFSLLGGEDMAQEPDFIAFKAKVDEMLAIYKSKDWDGARAAINATRALGEPFDIDETFYTLYEDRITAYEETPPGEDWDGVFVATTK